MNKKKIVIVINKPIKEVFEFTINPQNTPLWISHIKEEITDNYPPKIGTVYKNRGDSLEWEVYTVLEFEKDSVFTLKAFNGNYHVRYTYKKLSNTKTEVEYFEWVENGELNNPFTQTTLQRLKDVIEKM